MEMEFRLDTLHLSRVAWSHSNGCNDEWRLEARDYITQINNHLNLEHMLKVFDRGVIIAYTHHNLSVWNDLIYFIENAITNVYKICFNFSLRYDF